MYDPAYFPRIYPGLKRLATNLSGMNLLWLGMILILLSVESHSQTNKKYYFEQLNSLDGLSSNIVEDVFQDSDGFLWVCTKDGLNRYEGHSFITFKPSLKQQNTFSSNKFTCIAEDQKGKLWIGTKNSGATYTTYPPERSGISQTIPLIRVCLPAALFPFIMITIFF